MINKRISSGYLATFLWNKENDTQEVLVEHI